MLNTLDGCIVHRQGTYFEMKGIRKMGIKTKINDDVTIEESSGGIHLDFGTRYYVIAKDDFADLLQFFDDEDNRKKFDVLTKDEKDRIRQREEWDSKAREKENKKLRAEELREQKIENADIGLKVDGLKDIHGQPVKGHFEIQKLRPRHEGGCDHGSSDWIMVDMANFRVLREKGSIYWSGIGQQSYSSAKLTVCTKKSTDLGAEIVKGGKLNKKLAEQVSEKIAYILQLEPVMFKKYFMHAFGEKCTLILDHKLTGDLSYIYAKIREFDKGK